MATDRFRKRAALLDVLLVAGSFHSFSSPALFFLTHIILQRIHIRRVKIPKTSLVTCTHSSQQKPPAVTEFRS